MADTAITSFNTLTPAIVRTIREAFDEAVKEIETRRGTLPECERLKVSKHLVEMAKHGECSFERLRGAAMTALPL